MRLNTSSRAMIFGNIELNTFCNKAGISMNKLKSCNIEKMGENMYVFALSKESVPKSKNIIPLDTDIDSQPEVVLTMEFENNIFNFETTQFTKRVLNT